MTNGVLVRDLREKDFDVDWIQELHPGIRDEEVIEIARQGDRVLITEDKDFGEWVFAHKVSGLTIIFLRYTREEYPVIIDSVVAILNDLLERRELLHEFITISGKKVRRREI